MMCSYKQRANDLLPKSAASIQGSGLDSSLVFKTTRKKLILRYAFV